MASLTVLNDFHRSVHDDKKRNERFQTKIDNITPQYFGMPGPINDHPHKLFSPIQTTDGSWQVQGQGVLQNRVQLIKAPHVVSAPDGSVVPVKLRDGSEMMLVIARRVDSKSLGIFSPVEIWRSLSEIDRFGLLQTTSYNSGEQFDYSLHGFEAYQGKFWIKPNDSESIKMANNHIFNN